MSPQFQRVTELPRHLNPQAIEKAVAAFVRDSRASRVPLDLGGLYNQLIENIAAITVFKTPGHFFWAACEGGDVVAFALTHVSKDVDNSLCYWMSDAWVDPRWRRQPEVKSWFQQLRQHAKDSFCKHIIIPSSRGVKAYCRFLGKDWHPYVALLKQDLA
jgi:hypothetical protein